MGRLYHVTAFNVPVQPDQKLGAKSSVPGEDTDVILTK